MITVNNQVSGASAETKDSIGDVEHLRHDVGGASIRGGVSLALSVISCNIVRFVGAMVLARLLTPEQFGLIGMILAITSCIDMVKDFGLGTATVQQREITQEQVSTLFWINTGAGILTMILLAGLSPLLSSFYGDTRLLWASIVLSSAFLFSGLSVQHEALLRRHMRLTHLGIILVLSTALSFGIAGFLAWQGFEYWSLVWKEVSRAAFFAIGTWLAYRWLPGLPNTRCGIGGLLQTGKHLTAFNIVTFFSSNLGSVLLGKLWGPTPVGLYTQASQLLSLPSGFLNWPLSHVMTPALSALRSEPERYRRYYENAVSLLLFVYMPLVAYLALYSESIVTLVLGEKWIASAPVLRILAIGVFGESLISVCGAVMITCGRTRDYFRRGVVGAVLLCAAYVIGVQWGLTGLAMAYATCTYLTLLPFLWFSFKDTPISTSLFLKSLALPVISSMIMSALLIFIGYAIRPSNSLEEIGYSVLLAPVLYCGVWVLLPGGKRKMGEHVAYFRRAVEAFPLFARIRSALV